MALLDLSLVTKSLVKLIHTHVTASPEWPKQPPANTPRPLKVSPEPPDQVKGDYTLGLYLYHITEDGHFKNLPPPGTDPTPVRYTSMGLNLYYQLSAHSDLENDIGTYEEQRMLGLAVKALHDYPVIDDSTKINGVSILDPGLAGVDNRLRIILHPISANEAISYWTAGSSPLRLAVYYQVSVVLLEPEEPKSRVGRVLTYGVHTFVDGAPRLDGSSNVLSFPIPGGTDSREIELRPAQVSVGDTITFTGSGLTGDRTSLVLKNARWDEPVEVDAAWGVGATEDRVLAVVQKTADGNDVFPGIYSALIKVMKRRTMSDGSVREFEHTSNETPFVVTPPIDPNDVSAPDANRIVTVKSYIFKRIKDGDIPPEAVQVYLGSDALKKGTPGGLLDCEYAVVDAPPPDLANLQLRLPAGLTPGEFIPLRLFINGAESPPNWIEVL